VLRPHSGVEHANHHVSAGLDGPSQGRPHVDGFHEPRGDVGERLVEVVLHDRDHAVNGEQVLGPVGGEAEGQAAERDVVGTKDSDLRHRGPSG
jgi:hypothetical protein